eukprot:TRINITY_DN21713_c0_g1_i1.p1 TRINITY_DN21713_c0_g1~~TRINITY_DN21713_c0_g1_i1.p1  ORF type:complete len:979 (+),score=150.95 TRINITY_DN21713_c0_g1_i1:42-2978(+)
MSLMYTPISMGLHASPAVRKRASRQSRKPDWKADHTTRLCVGCKKKFSFTTRRHHCRRCGNIFCATCSSARKALHPTFGYGCAVVRQCRWCCSFDEDLYLLQMDEMDARQTIISHYYLGFQAAMLQLLPKILLVPKQRPALTGVLTQPGLMTPPMTPPLNPSVPFFDHKYDKTSYMSADFQEVSYVIATSISDCYLKDKRVNLKTYKSVFVYDEVLDWLSSNISSVSASDLLQFLIRTAIIEPVGDKLYRLKANNITDITENRKERLAANSPSDALKIGEVVTRRGGIKEYYIKEIKDDVYVLSDRSDTEEVSKSDVISSPFSKIISEITEALCGNVKDLNIETVPLLEVRYDLVKFSYLITKYIKGHLLSEHTLSMKQYHNVFDGSVITDLMMTMTGLSETDAIDFGELFHKMGMFLPIAGYSDINFDGTYQLFKIESTILESLEYCLKVKKKELTQDRAAFEIGDTVTVTASGLFYHREGFVTEYVSDESVCVSFPDGSSWVFVTDDLVTSPAVEVLQRAAKSDSERQPSIYECVHLRNLAMVFATEMTRSEKKYIKESFWQGLSRYKSVFTGEDAVTVLCELFPSLGSSNAVEVGAALMKGGLFVHPSEDPSASFEKKNCFKFKEESMKFLDDQYLLHEREVANNSDPANNLPIGLSIPLVRLLEDLSENGSVLETLPEGFIKPQLTSPPLGTSTPSVLDDYGDHSEYALETISPEKSARKSKRFSVPPPKLPQTHSRNNSGMALPPTTPVGPKRSHSTGNLSARANPNPLGRVSPNNRRSLFEQPPDLPRSSTLSPTAMSKAEIILDMVAFRKSGNQWYPHRFILRADRSLERHLLVGRILNGTRLRKQPVDDGDVWIEPPAYVDQADIVKIVSVQVQNGYQQIRSGSVVGYIRASNIERTESPESTITAADMSVSFSEVCPSDAEIKALVGKDSYSKGEWRNSSFLISYSGSVHHICCKSEQDRSTWMAALKN